jgi:hypothetical protein
LEKGVKMKSDLRELWINKIKTSDQAKNIIRDTSKGFYAVAVILALASFLLGRWLLLDSVICAGFGFWLHKRQSCIAATILLIYSLYTFINTAVNMFGGGEGGRNVVLAVMVLWASIRAVQATYKLPKLIEKAEMLSAS